MLHFTRRQFLKITGGFVAGTATVGSFSLINNLRANASAIITLKCLGDQNGPRFLDGRTFNGTVGLAPSTGGGFTGTRWEFFFDLDRVIVAFRCLGDQNGPRFLDGRTYNGTVGLAPIAGGKFSGALWDIDDNGTDNRIITIKSMGDQNGPRFLDGRTYNGTVGLAPSTGGGFTGTRWELAVVGSTDS
ncbi:hypothetical protein [Nostoc commune]|uniref:hypothetical protein n=1 Tax=Nostoc commune TaxID=1178 RepID=UPI0018C491B1|nr:hypothetical protein [Nostoc commune]MBG1261480.1 hypothetical protein [Nostoc commune BAE]